MNSLSFISLHLTNVSLPSEATEYITFIFCDIVTNDELFSFSDSVLPRVLIPVLATTLLWILVIFIIYVAVRQYKKKKKRNLLRQSESPDPVKDTTEQVVR